MRQWLVVLIVSLAFSPQTLLAQVIPLPVPYRIDVASPQMNGLQAWWLIMPHLRGGTEWYDMMGGYAGTMTNGAAMQVAKFPWWGRVALDGSDDYVDIGNLAAFDFLNTTFTVTFQVEEAVDTTSSSYWIAKRDPTPGIHGGYFIRTATGSGAITARISDNASNSAGQRSTAALNLYDGLRHHIAVVFTTDTVTLANNDVTIYSDGVLDQGARTDSSAGAYAACSCPLTFGMESDHASPARGHLNDVRFYARGLSALEVAQLAYQAKLADPGSAFGLAVDSDFFTPLVAVKRLPQVFE